MQTYTSNHTLDLYEVTSKFNPPNSLTNLTATLPTGASVDGTDYIVVAGANASITSHVAIGAPSDGTLGRTVNPLTSPGSSVTLRMLDDGVWYPIAQGA